MTPGLPEQADVAIVGAGVMGCSLAFYLARAGASVVVFERGAIGQGATGACAGGIRAQFSTEVNVRLGMAAKRVLGAFDAETGFSADFRRIGYLFLLTTDDERRTFAESVRMQRGLGLEDVRELTPRQARELVDGLQTDDLSGATFCPSDGLAGPNEVTHGYAAAARRLGARIVEDCPVVGFATHADSVRGVRTAMGETSSPVSVICAGPWAGSVAGLAGLDVPISPSRRQIFQTEPFNGLRRDAPMTIDFHSSFYFHPESGGVLFGMSDPGQPPGFELAVDWTFLERISAVAQTRWPRLLQAGVTNAWAGLYELTPDSQPLIGAVTSRPGLWIAAGFSGHGFMMGPVVGRLLADMILGRVPEIDLQAFDPDRFGAGRLRPERNVV
ncbi:MAG TPA: FAD-binding oxidoreductase [Candidatus Limnocylindrales bacterium]|nr:FAD-binding oxidoreductase [Candidatus Limnocylindrales bacterium]